MLWLMLPGLDGIQFTRDHYSAGNGRAVGNCPKMVKYMAKYAPLATSGGK